MLQYTPSDYQSFRPQTHNQNKLQKIANYTDWFHTEVRCTEQNIRNKTSLSRAPHDMSHCSHTDYLRTVNLHKLRTHHQSQQKPSCC